MPKKNVRKTKVSKKVVKKAVAPPEQIQIGLHNVFPYLVKMMDSLDRKVDRLQKTVDAVGLAVVEVDKMVAKLQQDVDNLGVE